MNHRLVITGLAAVMLPLAALACDPVKTPQEEAAFEAVTLCMQKAMMAAPSDMDPAARADQIVDTACDGVIRSTAQTSFDAIRSQCGLQLSLQDQEAQIVQLKAALKASIQ